MPQIPVSQIQVGIFRNSNTAMTKNTAKGVNVHTIHQTPFCEVVPQRMRGVGLVNSSSSQIALESRFKGVDF